MSTEESGELAQDEVRMDVRALREVFREAGAPLTTEEICLIGMIRNKD